MVQEASTATGTIVTPQYTNAGENVNSLSEWQPDAVVERDCTVGEVLYFLTWKNLFPKGAANTDPKGW